MMVVVVGGGAGEECMANAKGFEERFHRCDVVSTLQQEYKGDVKMGYKG